MVACAFEGYVILYGWWMSHKEPEQRYYIVHASSDGAMSEENGSIFSSKSIITQLEIKGN